jgi:hypothetical protein
MYWREVVASLYAWDLLDEGLDNILDTLEEEALVNTQAKKVEAYCHTPLLAREENTSYM